MSLALSSPETWPAAAVEQRAPDQLRHAARNARTHTEAQVDQIVAAIRKWGWTTPVLVDEHDVIIAGHGRLAAAKKLGLTSVPVMVARGWSDAEKRSYLLADNQIALNAGWDRDLLAVELADLKSLGSDLALVGFSARELRSLLPDDPAGGAAGGGDADTYREQYGVIVICRDEAQQRQVYERLSADGLEVKVVAT